MDEQLAWFRRLPADQRSWVTLVAQAGMASFVEWLRSPDQVLRLTGEVFGTAPRELARRVSLAADRRAGPPDHRGGRGARARRWPARARSRRSPTRCCGSPARSPSPRPGSTPARPRPAAPGTPGWRRWSSTAWSAADGSAEDRLAGQPAGRARLAGRGRGDHRGRLRPARPRSDRGAGLGAPGGPPGRLDVLAGVHGGRLVVVLGGIADPLEAAQAVLAEFDPTHRWWSAARRPGSPAPPR